VQPAAGGWVVRVTFNNKVLSLGPGKEVLPLSEFEAFVAPYTLQPGQENAMCGGVQTSEGEGQQPARQAEGRKAAADGQQRQQVDTSTTSSSWFGWLPRLFGASRSN